MVVPGLLQQQAERRGYRIVVIDDQDHGTHSYWRACAG
jgi:hypothetical protein